MIKDTVSILKDIPIIGVGGMTLFGVQLADIVLITTFVYTLVRIAKFGADWHKENKNDDTK